MSEKRVRNLQVRHRISGAALLGIREPTPPTMAIDAAPRAGDPGPRRVTASVYLRQVEGTVGFVDEEAPPVVTEVDDE